MLLNLDKYPILDLKVFLNTDGRLYLSTAIVDILFNGIYEPDKWYVALNYDANINHPVEIVFSRQKHEKMFDIHYEGTMYFIMDSKIFFKNMFKNLPITFFLQITSWTSEMYMFRMIEKVSDNKKITVHRKRNNIKYNIACNVKKDTSFRGIRNMTLRR